MSRRRQWTIRVTSAVVILILWQLLGSRTSSLFFSSPTAIVTAAKGMISSGELVGAIGSSLESLVAGLGIGIVLGVGLGLPLGRYRTAMEATEWLISALYATPLIAVIPLIILKFGLGLESKIFIVASLTFFPMLINTQAGVREVDRGLIDVGTSFAASEVQLLRKIMLPAALPFVLTGLRVAVGRGLIGVVAAEFFTGVTGLGAVVVKYGNQFDTAAMLVPVIVLAGLGVILTAIVRWFEQRVAPWKAAT